MTCGLCPRRCRIDRSVQSGYCTCGPLPRVAKIMRHYFEEPCISGSHGSGAIFFTGCNMSCVFCQNHELHDGFSGTAYTAGMLSDAMLSLQDQGVHNINLVTPTPHAVVLAEAISAAKSNGLSVPVVYNTNSYSTPETIRSLAGLVDIYLADLKYYSSVLSSRLSACVDYFDNAFACLREMYSQAGLLQIRDGLATKGLLIRHLILPGCVSDSRTLLQKIHDTFPPDITVSLMRQYTPTERVRSLPPFNRRLTDREYDSVLNFCLSIGLTNLYTQEAASADPSYTPDFSAPLTDPEKT